MDKKLLILLLALGLAGCVNDMPYTPKDTKPLLVMNSLLSVGEATHDVWLGVSKPGCVDTLTGEVDVRCFINGSLAATAVEQPGRQRLRRFSFPAALAEGDKVRLVASNDSFIASADVTVQSPPVLKSVDTLTVGDPEAQQLAFRIGMADKTPGADYYSLAITCTSQIEMYREGVLLGTEEFVRLCPLDTGDDLILSEDNIAAANMDSMFDVGTPNLYGAFFDSQFDCGSVTLRPKVDKWQMNSWYLTSFVPYDSCYVRPTLKVAVSHIDVRHYYYLKALNSLDGSSDLVLEEIAIPNNIEGGIGFVGVSNSAFQEFALPPYSTVQHFDDVPNEEPSE